MARQFRLVSDPASPVRTRPVQNRSGRWLVIIPLFGMVLSIAAIAWSCVRLLREAERGIELDPQLLVVSVSAFFLCAAAMTVVQKRRLMQRIRGPEQRLCEAMARMRSGDLAFRVHLRRGDHLSQTAAELNLLLDWLNENGPADARRGGDLIDMQPMDSDLGFELEPDPPAVVEELR